MKKWIILGVTGLFAGAAMAAPVPVEQQKTVWDYIKGEAPPNSLYLGMWSFHLNQESRREDNWNNQLVGGVYRSFFLGTFVNSFYERTYAFGVQRNVLSKTFANGVTQSLGYRVGLLHGYDDRLSRLAGETPLLPFAQLLYDVRYHYVGAEIAYTGVVISASFFIAFQ